MITHDQLLRVWELDADRLLLIARAIGEPAEDAVQEAFVRLAVQPSMPDDPLAWLVRVARNQLLQWHRSGKRRETRHRLLFARRDWFAGIDLDARLDAAQVTAALQQLPVSAREIVVMQVWGELSFEKIATLIGVSRATAHRQYTAALEQLRQQFPSLTMKD